MKIPISVVVLLFAIGSAATATAQPIKSSVDTLPADTKLAGPGVLYSNSFFQERYMKVGRTIAYGLFVGGLYQQAVWRATGTYEGKAPVRQEANAFEALLGDFDITAHVSERLRARIPEARHFSIELTGDPALAETLVTIAAAQSGAGTALQADPPPDVICAVKVSYGLGARAGREQFGFKKTYRPFVRLRAVVKKNSGGEEIWSGAVIAWGAKGYKGAEADAKKIQREELIDAFRTVSDEAITLLVRSLNGEKLEPMGELVDETKEDTRM